jgi:formylglycine-generating enzyme required for sulfatase activity
MTKVFISYSRKDAEFAKWLTTELKKSDLDFWIDWEGIPPTVDWWKEIEKGIEESDAFLFLISPDSVKSKVCGQEIDHAVKNGKRLIPLAIREADTHEIHPKLKPLNWIFFRERDDFDISITKLLTAIHTDYDWVQVQRRLQVKALEWERNHKENSFLLRGTDLKNAKSLLNVNGRKEPQPTDLLNQFVVESHKYSENQLHSTRLRWIAIAVAGIVLLMVIIFIPAGIINRFIYRPVNMENYWVTVPTGEFQMGSEGGDEAPVHIVYLDAYQIGKYEITNKQYDQCIRAGACKGTIETDKLDHPVIGVSWFQAKAYCGWVSGRLPTEAEWEKAASWDVKTQTKFIYPWGNDNPSPDLLNYNNNVSDTTPVGEYVAGENGLYDMAGNVWEWVNDWYSIASAQGSYYQNSPLSNPLGPDTGQERVLRGGGWNSDDYNVRSVNRLGSLPTEISRNVGFRCSRNMP